MHIAPSLPWLQPVHVWATCWLALIACMSPTSWGTLKGTAAACAALLPPTASTPWCLSQFIWSIVESLSCCMMGTLPLCVPSASRTHPPTLP